MRVLTFDEKALVQSRYRVAIANKSQAEYWVDLAVRFFTLDGLIAQNGGAIGFSYMDKLRNKLSSLVVNSNYIWGYLDAPRFEEISNEDKKAFDKITEKVFDVLQTKSNFEAEKASILSDFLIGTACFKVSYTGDLFAPVRIDYTKLENVALGRDVKGKAGDVFEEKQVYKGDLIDAFGVEVLKNDRVSTMKEDDKRKIVEGVVYNYKTKKYLFVASFDANFDEVIYCEEMAYNPWVIARCEKMRGSPYGAGPAIKATKEIAEVLSKKENIQKIGEKLSRPAWLFYGDIRFAKRARINTPGAVTIMGKPGQNSFAPVNQGADLQIDFFSLEENKQILNDLFFIDFITNIKDVDTLKGITATATQIAVTKFAEQIEPMYAMLQKELLEPTVLKTFECCKRANLINLAGIQYLKKPTAQASIRFYNAITIAQEQDDLERANMYVQDIASKFGAQGVAANINAKEHIDAQRKRYRVKNDEFKSGEETEKALEEIMANSQAPTEMIPPQRGQA